MRRRDLLAGVAAALVSSPAAIAQQKTMPVIGYLNTIVSFQETLDEFRRGLAETGFVEGRNVRIEYRMAAGDYARLPSLAAELVRLPVDVIVAVGGALSGMAAKAATDTIPIVVVSGDDPVKLGLAESLARPGGNVTGVSQLAAAADPKRLELLHELVPAADRIAHLINPANANAERQVGDLVPVARSLGVELVIMKARSNQDFARVFDTISQTGLRALNLEPDPLFVTARDELVAVAQRHVLPTMYFFREFVTVGGLISFGSKLTEAYHQVGYYAGRILKGAKPSELPIVQQSEQLELAVNLKTANALGLKISPLVLARADEIIE